MDGVYTLAKDPKNLDRFASASGDGVVKVWDLPSRDEVWQAQAHEKQEAQKDERKRLPRERSDDRDKKNGERDR